MCMKRSKLNVNAYPGVRALKWSNDPINRNQKEKIKKFISSRPKLRVF